MLRFLHTLSAWLFYILAGSFFVAYLLLAQKIGEASVPLWWMRVMDGPLAVSAILYGVTSLLRSVIDPARPSWTLLWSVVVPALVLIAAILIANFGFLLQS